jgi:hypothetical protein
MMLFDPKVGLNLKRGNVAGRQGEGREIMSATLKQRKTRVGECSLGQDQRRVTLSQGLKKPMK